MFNKLLIEGFNRMAKSPVDTSTNGATTLKLCRESIQSFYLPELIKVGGTEEEIQYLEEYIQEITDAIEASTHPNGAVIDEVKNGFDLSEFGSLQNLIKNQVGFEVKGRKVKMDFFISQEVVIDNDYPHPKNVNGRRYVCQHWWDLNQHDVCLGLNSIFLSIMSKLQIKVGLFYSMPRFLGYNQRAYCGSFSTAKIMTALRYNEIQNFGTVHTGIELSAQALMDELKESRKDVLNDLRTETKFAFDLILEYRLEKDRLVKLKEKMEKASYKSRTFKEQELQFLAERQFSKKESVQRFMPHVFGTKEDERTFNDQTYLGIISKLERNRTEIINKLNTYPFKSTKEDLVNGLFMMVQKDIRVAFFHIEECMPFATIEFAKKSMHVWNGKDWAPVVKHQASQFQYESETELDEEPMFFDDVNEEEFIPVDDFNPNDFVYHDFDGDIEESEY